MMKTKQIITILAVLIVGILIGKFAFATKTKTHNHHKNETAKEHWTCSMHPQIDMPEFGACPICGMDLILKEKNAEGLSLNEIKMSKNAMALANIETQIIGSNESFQNKTSLKLSGKITVNDKASAIQTAHFGGRIEQLKYKSVGEFVTEGSFIASIYSPELVTAQNEFIEAINIKNEQPELYKAVRNKLKNWKISENQIVQIEQTKKVITNFKMYANVSGYIEEIFVEEGNHIKEGSPLFKVSNLGTVWAVFDVYEQDIKNLKMNQKLVIVANAYPDKKINARINFINPNLDIATRTVQVRATLVNSKNELKPGMLLSSQVELTEKLNTKTKAIEIPKTAILWTGKRSIVYVKTTKNEPVFELREVTLGNANAINYQVLSGLKDGEEIVVNGAFTVDAAAQLQGKSSMMNKKVVYEDKKMKKEKQKEENVRIEVNSTFKKQLNAVIHDYINLKDAFVLTNVAKVNSKAKQTLKNLKKVNMKLLKNPKAPKIWMPNVKIIKESLQMLTKQTDIEKQRTTFINLSNAMLLLANSFGVEETIYVQHCPMANDNKGADWLSTEKEIRNPYFGDKMLKCGSVEQIIK